MKRWKEDLTDYLGISSIHLKNVPMCRSRKGRAVDMRHLALERQMAKAIVMEAIPIRGRELRLLRTALELSYAGMARKLALSSSAIFYWEKAENVQLLPVNEIAIRVLCAGELGVEVAATLTQMIGSRSDPVVIEVTKPQMSKAKRKKD